MQFFFLNVFLQLVLTSGDLGDVLGPKVTAPGLQSQVNCPGIKRGQRYLVIQAMAQWDTGKPQGQGVDLCAVWIAIAIGLSEELSGSCTPPKPYVPLH